MKKSLFQYSAGLILCIILTGYCFASTQTTEPVILKNHIEHYSLGPNLAFLEDSQAKLTIEDIRDPAFTGRWQLNKTEVPAFGFTSSVYWFAVELQNAKGSRAEQLLVLSYPLLDSVDIYLDRNGKIIDKFHAGDQEAFAQRLIEHRHFLFPIKLSEDDRITLYLRVKTSSSMQIPLTLSSERVFWKADQRALIMQGIYFGIMLVMILYNLFIYSVVLDRSYIYYVLFVSCFVVFQLTLRGFSYQYIWPQYPWFNDKILILSVCAALFFGGLFTTSLLGLKQQSIRSYKLIILACLIALINAVAAFVINYKAAIGISLANAMLMSSVGLATGCIMWQRGYTPARYYTMAWLVLLAAVIAFALSKFGFIPRNQFTENGIQLGSVIEVILLSLALANRITVILKEKALAQAETVSILKKYQSLYENAIEGIFQLTLQYNFVSANRATQKMLGLTNKVNLFSGAESYIGCYFTDRSEVDELSQLLLEKGEIIGHEFKAKKFDGSEFWASISVQTIFDDEGEPLHYEGSLVNITEKREAEEKIRYMAYYDNVTGLPNRVFLHDLLKHALERAKRNVELVALLFVDLNRFKLVNDTLGHNAGDRLLQEVAERLSHCLRGGDWVGRPQSTFENFEAGASSGSSVARLGGDEFVMVITDIHHAEDAAIIARRVGEALEQLFTLDGKEVYISASIGISTYPLDGDNPATLLKKADAAMYHIKQQGINDYQFYADSLGTHDSKKLTLETELRNALCNNQFELYYQPKLDLNSGKIVGVEALCRWQHPERGLILPNDFIGLAEEIGLIVPLGKWVLSTACKQNKSWQDAGLVPIRVSVNVSVRQFAEEELSKTILEALNNSGLDSCFLELELTESILMDHTEVNEKILDELKGMGLCISIDDFGTGYSSLSYLKRLPVDILKIDRIFIQDITEDTNNQAITTAIIAMAGQLGLKVIAEGVETEAQMHYLREHLCNEIQGFFVSEPLPVAQFTRLLQRCEKSGLLFSLHKDAIT